MKIPLISGAGNTFYFIEDTDKRIDKKSFVIDLCKKNFADGVVFLNKKKAGEYTWDFYNNDGSVAEMCGNAARSAGAYIFTYFSENQKTVVLNTLAGRIYIENPAPHIYQLVMTPFKVFTHAKYFYCNTGVPHILYFIDDIKTYSDYKEICKQLRFHNDFIPQGVNVTLVQVTKNENVYKAVSYERGVEDFTQACGTGAASVALYNLVKNNKMKTNIEMPGGTLMMDLSNSHRPLMLGPAHIIKEVIYEG